MEKLLNKIKKEHKLVCLYASTTEENEYTGYLTDIRDDYFLFERIDEDGYADGYILGNVSAIYSIEIEHKYHRRIELLHQLKGQTCLHLEVIQQHTLLKDVIAYCEKHHLVATFYPEGKEDDYIVGFVKRVGELVEIRQLDQYGDFLGISYRNIDQIAYMTIEGRYEQSRRILYEYQTSDKMIL